jgi:hypothetical protein
MLARRLEAIFETGTVNGRRRRYRIVPARLSPARIAQYERFWDQRLERRHKRRISKQSI